MNNTVLLFFPLRLRAKYESQYLENGPLATILNSRTQIRVHGKGKKQAEKSKTKNRNKRNYQEASCNLSTKLHVELFEVTTVLPCCGKYPPKLSTNISSCIQNNTWSSEFFL